MRSSKSIYTCKVAILLRITAGHSQYCSVIGKAFARIAGMATHMHTYDCLSCTQHESAVRISGAVLPVYATWNSELLLQCTFIKPLQDTHSNYRESHITTTPATRSVHKTMHN